MIVNNIDIKTYGASVSNKLIQPSEIDIKKSKVGNIYTQLSSKVGFKGIIKKIIIFIVISTAYVIQCLLGEEIPLREITILFFIANEGISLIENASEFVPIPKKLKDVLIQIRKEGDE